MVGIGIKLITAFQTKEVIITPSLQVSLMIIIIIAEIASRRRTTEVELLDERAGWNSQRNDELNYQVQQYHPLEHIYRQFVRIHGRV